MRMKSLSAMPSLLLLASAAILWLSGCGNLPERQATRGVAESGAPDAHVVNGPSFRPPFEIKQGERVAAELRMATFLDPEANNQPAESATLVFGNKRVSVREGKDKKMETGRDNVVSIFVNEVPVFDIIMVGGYQGKDGQGVGMIGGKRLEGVEFAADPETGVIRWSRRYPLPDGTQAEMAYELKSPGESRVEVSWDIGLTDEQIKRFRAEGNDIGGMLVYFDVKGDYRKDGLKIDGANIRPKTVDELKAKEKQLQIIWEGALHELSSAPGKPLHGFAVHSEKGLKGSLREVFQYGRIDLGFMFGVGPRDSLVLDLGQVAPPDKSAPPAIEGHDLWVQDALHLPKSPTRNLFPNPSFEQGLLYWRWWGGGAKYEPSEVPRHAVDRENGRFGRQAMVINPVQRNSAPLRSFSMPGAKGQTYTLSFYAKAETAGAGVRLAPYSSKAGGQFTRETVGKFKSETLGQDWQRYSYSFVSDGTPISFILLAEGMGGRIWLDGLQLEAAAAATEFAAPPLEGELTTSHPQNNVEFGDKIEATYAIRGAAGTQGKLSLELRDFFKERVWSRQYDTRAGETLDLPFDDLKLGTGVYLLKSTFAVPGLEPYVAYYRFTVIDSLDGTHATKDLYGALISARISRTEEALELMQRLGFAGSSSYGGGKNADPINYELREKFNITDYTHEVVECPHLTAQQKRDRHPDYLLAMSINPRIWRTAEERKTIPEPDRYSDEVLRQFEDLCERVARECPYVRVWSIATEEEIVFPALYKRRDFLEFAKLQEVFYRGIKRGNPNALALPAGGTSGYGKTRGKDDIDGFLSATQGKIKWDAVAIHPYGAIDGTLGFGDLDESLQMLRESMAKYGYGEETPMFLNEGGGGASSLWGDGPFYSYDGGQPSYDQGMMEFLHACKMASQYIICLKYWPQLKHFNTWQSDDRWIVDHNLTPSSFLLGINTLGHMLGEPKFIADVRPAAGVRGYAFEDKTHGGVAAVWCTIDDVERGFVKGPVMRVRFDGDLPELVDLMGRRSVLKAGADGSVDIQLTPAPLFLNGKDPQALATALQEAEVLGTGSNVAVSFLPTLQGGIDAIVKNLTSREQMGELEIDGQAVSFQVAGSQEQKVHAAEGGQAAFGKMFIWNKDYLLTQPETEPAAKQWGMDYFYVSKVTGTPDWNQVPAIPMPNLYRPVVDLKQTLGGHAGDISATFQAAWDKDRFYLRVEAEDDIFDPSEVRFWSSEQAQVKALYMLDGCLEVYFDCAANGRLGNRGFDLDDYRYDFSPGNPEGTSGPGKVHRFYEVFNEYAGGVEFPTKEEAAKGVKCEFTRLSPTRYAYTITFAQRYIAPLRLEAGYTAGFALYLHDRMDDGEFGNKGLSLATEPGAHADRSPHLWPLMILSE